MSFKSETQNQLSLFHEAYGFNRTLELAKILLNSTKFRDIAKEGSSPIQGEISEMICKFLLEDHIKRVKWKGAKVYQSVYLKDLDPSSDRITEIDLILITPQVVFLIEVKSYSGDKRVVGEGVIVRGDKRFDVYSQHMGHYRAFMNMFNVVAKRGTDVSSVIVPIVFLFANGTFTDERSPIDKKFMPVLNDETLRSFLDSFRGREPVWDIPLLSTLLDYIQSKSSNLAKEHLLYLKKQHSK